jgi:hypothetical protein
VTWTIHRPLAHCLAECGPAYALALTVLKSAFPSQASLTDAAQLQLIRVPTVASRSCEQYSFPVVAHAPTDIAASAA